MKTCVMDVNSELLLKLPKGPVIKYLLQGAEDIGRGHQKFDGLVNGPRKIFADFQWAMKCVSE